MRFFIFSLAALAHLTLLSSAAPVGSPAPETELLPRTTYCTNYPSKAAGSLIKRDINWCRENSNEWIYFPVPGNAVASQATFGTLFVNGLNKLTASINEGKANAKIPIAPAVSLYTPYRLSSVNGINLDAYQTVQEKLTFANLKVCVEILQNYVYVEKRYTRFVAECMVGGVLVGQLIVGPN